MGSANVNAEIEVFNDNLKKSGTERALLPALAHLAEAIAGLSAAEKKELKALLGL